MKTANFKIISLFLSWCIFSFIYSSCAFGQDSLQISLVYPQKSNAPKRVIKAKEEPLVIKGQVYIDILDIKPEQINHPDLYLEYFLDNQLIYSTQEKKESKLRKKSLGFILDTRLYPDGKHTLVVNLWDKDGSSAIGVREIIIQNQSKNEN